MNFELVKKLKDAGLGNGSLGFLDDTQVIIISGLTLSELIEACNPTQFDDFGLSTGYTDQWEAWATYHGEAIPEVDLKMTGDTPEEAVANLWLELNKK